MQCRAEVLAAGRTHAVVIFVALFVPNVSSFKLDHFAWLRCLQPSAPMLLFPNDKCCCTEVEGGELLPLRLA